MSEIHDIIEVEVIGDHALRVTFDDGAVREVNLEGKLDGPVFESLRDPERFAQVTVDRAPTAAVPGEYDGARDRL